MPTLQRGATGTEVQTLQDNLHVLRYTVYGTAVYDEVTISAVKAFRQATWAEPGGDDCEQETFDAVTYFADQTRTNGEAPPTGGDSGSQTGPTVVDQQGKVLARVEPKKVERSGQIDSLGQALHLVIESTIPGIGLLQQQSGTTGYTYAIGLDADAAAALGLTVGVGLYVPASGEIGLYASFGADSGAVAMLSAGVAVTVVMGGPELFAGPCWAIEASGSLGLGVSGAMLYSVEPPYAAFGYCAEVGVGVGGGVFMSYTHTWLTGV